MGKKNLTRRQFVATLTTGTGTVLLGSAILPLTATGPLNSSGTLKTATLGKSGLTSSLVGLGTGFSGYDPTSNIARAGLAESLIRHAYEKGIRFFDCADSYGTHQHTASALKTFPRESYTLSTKIWVSQGGISEPERPDAFVALDRFRKELNTDYIDLVQIHCMTDGKWTDKQKRQMDILETLKSRKIILAHGVSVHSLEALEACVENPWVDVVHVRVNPFGEAMDNSNPELIASVIEKIHRSGKGVIGMKLLGSGKLKNDPDKIDESLRYVLGLRTVDLILAGFEQPEQIDSYLSRVRSTLKSI